MSERQRSLVDSALDAIARGDAASAVTALEEAVRLDPNDSEAVHGLICALEEAGRTDDALAVTQQRIAASPDDVLAVTRLSMIYQHKGMVPEAEAAAARAKILGWKQEIRSGISPKNDL